MTIKNAAPGPDRTIRLELSEVSSKTIGVTHLLVGPVFETIRNDQDAFNQLYVDPRLETVCWPGDLDLAPETLAALPDPNA